MYEELRQRIEEKYMKKQKRIQISAKVRKKHTKVSTRAMAAAPNDKSKTTTTTNNSNNMPKWTRTFAKL